MIQVSNDGFGLLRVLGPDISAFIGVTILIVALVWLIGKLAGVGAVHATPPGAYAEVVKVKRSIRNTGFWIWLFVFAVFIAHAVAVTASLRIPRSDVNATGVYLDMNSAIEGRSPR